MLQSFPLQPVWLITESCSQLKNTSNSLPQRLSVLRVIWQTYCHFGFLIASQLLSKPNFNCQSYCTCHKIYTTALIFYSSAYKIKLETKINKWNKCAICQLQIQIPPASWSHPRFIISQGSGSINISVVWNGGAKTFLKSNSTLWIFHRIMAAIKVLDILLTPLYGR